MGTFLLITAMLLSAWGKVSAVGGWDSNKTLALLGWEFGPSIVLPISIIEIVLAIGLLSRWKPLASILVWGMFLAFSLVTLVVWVGGDGEASCGCFGTLDIPTEGHLLVLVGGLLISQAISAAHPLHKVEAPR